MSEKEDVETYLDLFEKHEQFLEIPKEIWTAHLRPLLNSRARDVLVGAQALDEADFDALRAHLVKALGCRTESANAPSSEEMTWRRLQSWNTEQGSCTLGG